MSVLNEDLLRRCDRGAAYYVASKVSRIIREGGIVLDAATVNRLRRYIEVSIGRDQETERLDALGFLDWRRLHVPETEADGQVTQETATIRLAVQTLQNACDKYANHPGDQDAAGNLYVEAGRAVSMLLATPDGYDPELDRPVDSEAVS